MVCVVDLSVVIASHIASGLLVVVVVGVFVAIDPLIGVVS